MRIMRRGFSSYCCALAAFAGSALWSMHSNAMVVTPLVAEMQSSGGKSKAIVRVTNDGAQPLPIEFKFSRIEVDENGAATYTPSDGEFKIFPQRSNIDPGKSQVFQVQWINSSPLEKSRSYTLSVNQLPVKFPTSKTGVQVVYNMSIVLNVSPPDAKGAIAVVSSAVTKDATGRQRPAVIVQNSGNRHVNLADTTLNLSSGKWSKTLTNFELKQLIGVGLVQPGKRRKFVFPVDLPAGVTTMAATIDASGLTTSALTK
jgi:fimbrial chaperone protein